jgi:tRNA(adenine34) deaminase
VQPLRRRPHLARRDGHNPPLCPRHPGIDWTGLTLYSTAEPCPTCQSAILWAGISRVVFGTSIRTLQRLGWWQIDIPAEEVMQRTPFRQCELAAGVLEAECDALFQRPPDEFDAGQASDM